MIYIKYIVHTIDWSTTTIEYIQVAYFAYYACFSILWIFCTRSILWRCFFFLFPWIPWLLCSPSHGPAVHLHQSPLLFFIPRSTSKCPLILCTSWFVLSLYLQLEEEGAWRTLNGGHLNEVQDLCSFSLLVYYGGLAHIQKTLCNILTDYIYNMQNTQNMTKIQNIQIMLNMTLYLVTFVLLRHRHIYLCFTIPVSDFVLIVKEEGPCRTRLYPYWVEKDSQTVSEFPGGLMNSMSWHLDWSNFLDTSPHDESHLTHAIQIEFNIFGIFHVQPFSSVKQANAFVYNVEDVTVAYWDAKSKEIED